MYSTMYEFIIFEKNTKCDLLTSDDIGVHYYI